MEQFLNKIAPNYPNMPYSNFLTSSTSLFHYYKKLAEDAIDQLDDEQLFFRNNENENSIAIIFGHLIGNMKSRFTDFLNADGEKEWRNRDQEFEPLLNDRLELLERWEEAWATVFQALSEAENVGTYHIVYIRNEGHTVMEAIQRQLAHYAYHVGQIVVLAKHVKGSDWKSLSIPKGGSDAFNQEKFQKEKSKKHFTDGS
ncbi:MAG: DUF1572 family protein [Saprospiraceae bacterium]